MKRQRIVAGNWKMNLDFNEGRDLANGILRSIGSSEVLTILCPPFIHLHYISVLTNGIANIEVGAQNCHAARSGAFTGEVSAAMIKSTGASHVIIGHSERREFFDEGDALLAEKVKTALANDLCPIFCCGEKLEIREAGTHQQLVKTQLEKGLFHLDSDAFSKIVIAYEPVWAIGTGKTATPAQAQEMHQFIRSLVAAKYSQGMADNISILYGGSCKPDNAVELFSQPDVDGGLIGGASLKATDFVAIIDSFPQL